MPHLAPSLADAYVYKIVTTLLNIKKKWTAHHVRGKFDTVKSIQYKVYGFVLDL